MISNIIPGRSSILGLIV